MKLTKDEARVLAHCIYTYKYEGGKLLDGEFTALEDLEYRLEEFGRDGRRNGRTSLDSLTDCVKRFIKKYKTKRK